MKKNALTHVERIILGFIMVLSIGCSNDTSNGVQEKIIPGQLINITYTGNTQQAAITIEDAEDIAITALNVGSFIPGGFEPLFSDVYALSGPTEDYDRTPDDPTLITVSKEYSGPCGGSLHREFEISTISKNSEGRLEYHNYCDNSDLIYHGRILYKQTYSLRTNSVAEIDITFNNLTIQSNTQTLVVAGTLKLTFNEMQELISELKDLVIQDRLDGSTYWINDFLIEYTYNENNSISMNWSGRYYDFDDGYIDMDTTQDMEVKPEKQPHEGVLKCTGLNNSSIELLFKPLFLMAIECDADGDHVIDWDTELQLPDPTDPYATRPVAHAGEDRETWVGATVNLDGSLSTGRGGNTHYYDWSFESCPQDNCPPLLVNEYTKAYPSFVPDIAGDYILKLYVYDFTYSSLADTVTITVNPMAEPGFLDMEWQFSQFGAYISNAGMSMCDIDGDGRLEIITDGRIDISGDHAAQKGYFWYVVRHTSDQNYEQVGTSKNYSQRIQRIVTADADNDGIGEIYVGLENGHLYVYDGRTLERQKAINVGGTIQDILIADANGDGQSDMLVCEQNAIHIYDPETSSLIWETKDWGGRSIAVGNVDTDSPPEIVTSYGYIIDGVTHELEWKYDGGYGGRVRLYDADEDGMDEVFMGYYSSITLLEADKQDVGWKMAVVSDLLDFVIADSDADGIPEIITSNSRYNYVHGIDMVSRTEKWVISGDYSNNNHVAAGDMDGDGSVEVAWGSNEFLFIGDPATETIEWKNINMVSPFNAVDAGDVNGDEVQEIVFTSFESEHDSYQEDGTLSVFQADSHEVLWQSTDLIDISSDGAYSLKVRDMDGDSIDDIVIGIHRSGQNDVFQVYDGVTYALKSQSEFADRKLKGAVEFYDLYQNDTLTLISGQMFDGPVISVIDGNTLTEQWYSSPMGDRSDFIYDIELSNVDADENMEILASVRGEAFWILDGITHEVQFISTNTQSHAIETCDIDGDGHEEILVGREDGVIDIYAGTTFELKSTKTIPHISGEMFVLRCEDIDQNGLDELIVSSQGALYIIDPASDSLIWSQARLGHNLGLNNQIVVNDLDQDGRKDILIGSDLAVYHLEFHD